MPALSWPSAAPRSTPTSACSRASGRRPTRSGASTTARRSCASSRARGMDGASSSEPATARATRSGAARLAAGLDGVRRKLDPGDPFNEDVARSSAADLARHGIVRTPWSLDRALDALEADDALARVLGPELVQAFLHVKRSESAKFSAYVSDWEYRYYAEQH